MKVGDEVFVNKLNFVFYCEVVEVLGVDFKDCVVFEDSDLGM